MENEINELVVINSLEISGLQCDNCDYVDSSIKLEDYKSYINCSCPKCGESLLTQTDYDIVQKMVKLHEKTKDIQIKPTYGLEDFKGLVQLNGTGEIKYRKEEL